jgi:hypothetical protein
MQPLMPAIDRAEGLHSWVFLKNYILQKVARKRLACVGPEVGDSMDGGTVYTEYGELRDGTLVEVLEEELSLMGGGDQGTRRKSVAVMPRVRAVWLTFATVDVVLGDRNASSWLLVVFIHGSS